MRILLLSLGLGAVPRYLRKGATLGFVPTAGEPYADPYFVREDRARLEQLGYKLVDIDLSRQSAAQVRSSLAPIEALFVAGGNTFYLMQQLCANGAQEVVLDFIAHDHLYIGASAGAVILGPSIEPIKSLDDPTAAPALRSMDGLRVIDFVVLPHYGKAKYEQKYADIEATFASKHQVVKLRDDQAIEVSARDRFSVVESELILHPAR